MPILVQEIDLFPGDLLARAECELREQPDTSNRWWALYTLSRQEKQLMRKLRSLEIPFFGPTISRRYRSPAGRVRTVHQPLFSNYVFIFGTDEQRYGAVTTHCVSKHFPVVDGVRLTADLGRIHRLIQTGCALTPESRLVSGDRVRVRTGTFAGFEGTVIRRHGETRLLVAVEFMQQGASVLLDDCQLDPLGRNDRDR